jgi:formylglycine-generating enzyme required for sulfatase activity
MGGILMEFTLTDKVTVFVAHDEKLAKKPAWLADWIDFEADHSVTLTDDYFIGQFEVTRGQFRRFVEEAGYTTDAEHTEGGYGWNEELKKFEGRDKNYSWANTGAPGKSDAHPVTNISRADARKFCEWLAQKADGKVRLREVRLPGDAEWEFACRAGGIGRFCFGDDEEKLAEYANTADAFWNERFPNPRAIKAKDGHVFAATVGQFKPNNFGLYDMHGNVWEWCDDFYGKYAALPKERNQIQTINQGQLRGVMRGGACYANPSDNRCAFRWLVGAGSSRYENGGFRVV